MPGGCVVKREKPFRNRAVREKEQVQARYLLGPAGTGKTYRCLHEIAERLRANPEGRDLILVAPKQATFQLERQLLTDFDLPGFTRLRILSFERLADYVITKLNSPTLEMLSEEGRVMVLRALLRQRKGLKIFHASASMAGFARQLSGELREFQRYQLTPARLDELSANKSLPEVLRRKLHDLGHLLDAYTKWLDEHRLRDVDCLLAVAAEQLKANPNSALLDIEGLWLDGFAEMTPQELALLSAIAPRCENMTLAFCLDRKQTRKSWLSIWSSINETVERCQKVVGTGVVEDLPRDASTTRFATAPAFRFLEQHWDNGHATHEPAGMRIAACANPEAEVTLAARELIAFVRAGNRFRDCAVSCAAWTVIKTSFAAYSRDMGFRIFSIAVNQFPITRSPN